MMIWGIFLASSQVYQLGLSLPCPAQAAVHMTQNCVIFMAQSPVPDLHLCQLTQLALLFLLCFFLTLWRTSILFHSPWQLLGLQMRKHL